MDFWREIFMALGRNKLRTFLTGFAISWGIFILIVLLAAGNGLMNGVSEEFSDQRINVYMISFHFPKKRISTPLEIPHCLHLPSEDNIGQRRSMECYRR